MEMVHFIPAGQRHLVLLAAQTDTAPVLVFGASGTGKGAIAHWIHSHGPRANRVFQVANSERDLAEQIAEANGGTLVIPEIAEWSLSDQMILLDYLKTKNVTYANSSLNSGPINTRIIGTTSHALDARAQGGLFNLELVEKLNVFRIEMPPLAKRTEDFEEIVGGIFQELKENLGKTQLRGVSPEAWGQIQSYDWPGNLRELRNVLRVAIASSQGEFLTVNDLPELGATQIDFRATREQFEKLYLQELLQTYNWEIDRTCMMSSIDKNTLISKIKHYGIAENRSIS